MRVSNNSSLNVSYCSQPVVTPAYVYMYVSLSLVVIFTVCGNVIVVVSVIHFKQLHTPTNVLIMSLALTDLSVGAFVMPLHFVWLIESCWVFGDTICIFFNFMAYCLTSASVHTVALIAVDRYLALSNPFFYCNKITTGLMIGVVAVNWICSLVYNVVLLHCNRFLIKPMYVGECFVEVSEIWYWVDFVVVFIVPCFIIFTLYLQVFAIATRHANAIRAFNNQANQSTTNNNMPKQHERKAAKVLGILVFVFLFCLVPYYTFTLMSEKLAAQVSNDIWHYLSSLLYLNSFFNPIIYALFYPWFQTCVRLMFRSWLCCLKFSLIAFKFR